MVESLRLGWGMDGPRRARGWIRDVCMTNDLDGLADDACLLVSELVTNTVLHAGTDCELRLEVGDQAMRVDVMDQDNSDVRPVDTDSARRAHGLNIVDSVAAGWGVIYRDGGKTVWFTLVSGAAMSRHSHSREARTADPHHHARGQRSLFAFSRGFPPCMWTWEGAGYFDELWARSSRTRGLWHRLNQTTRGAP